MYVIPGSKYTLDSSGKTITLSGSYAGITLPEIRQITDLTKDEILYNVENLRRTITLSEGVITYTGGDYVEDTDYIRIEIEEKTPADAAYNSTTDSKKFQEQSPLDSQPIPNIPMLDNITADATSTYSYVNNKQRMTFFVYCASGTATLQILGKPHADEDGIPLRIIDSVSGSSATSLSLVADTDYVITLEGNPNMYQVAAAIASVSSATISVYMIGGAL